MYYPILRGRQNELLAIRELAQANKLTHVVPVIEPVKASSTLLKTIDALSSAGVGLMVVTNPAVGSFGHDLRNDPEYFKRYEQVLGDCKSIVYAYRLDSNDDLKNVLQYDRIAYFYPLGYESQYARYCKRRLPDYTFAAARDMRQKRRAKGGLISLEEGLEIQKRNIDYRTHEDDFLTEEHLFFASDGYCGFSDYSVIGNGYNEGGFMPQVVAIHLAYFTDDQQIHIRHFTSDDGYGDSDVAGKFQSALVKLVKWAEENDVPKTDGLVEFINIRNEERFPGLGFVKKLSIKHHLEMVDCYLDGVS